MAQIPLDKWAAWWAGADKRVLKAKGTDERGWLKNKWHSIYDMGQNLDILLEWKLGKKDVNWLEIPGRENCSGFVASIYDCAFHAISWPGLYPWQALSHVYETADVAPGHVGLSQYFRPLEPGEPVRAGSARLHMSWDDPQGNIDDLLKKALTWFAMIHSPVAFFANLVKVSPELFRDGIKVTQRDRFKVPDPYWRSTHLDYVWRNDNSVVSIVGQEETFKQYSIKQDDLYEKMEGDKPHYIIFEPTFLYGETASDVSPA